MLKFIKKILNNKIAVNALASGMLKPVSMIISYIYVPIVLNYLGVEMYGAWSAILAVLSWISYFDIGIGNGLRNKLTEAIAKKDTERCKKLISSAYIMLAVIVAALSSIFIVVSALLDWNDILGVKEPYSELTTVVILSIMFVSLNFVLLLCKNVLCSFQKNAFAFLLDICAQLLNMAGVIIASCFTKGNLLIVSIIYGCSMILSCVLFSSILYTKHRELAPSFRYFDFSIGKEVSSLGLNFFVIQISGLVLCTTDSVIISNLYGAENVTPYSIVNKIFTAIIGVNALMLSPFQTGVTEAQSENDIAKIKKIVHNVSILILPFSVLAILISVLFVPITTLWLGQELDYGIMIWLGLAYCIEYIIGNTYGVIASGLNILKVQMAIAIAQAIVNIPLSLLFSLFFGMGSAGILLGTVSTMLISTISMPAVVYSAINSYGKHRGKQL